MSNIIDGTVLFFISSFREANVGVGGHYYSLIDIAKSIRVSHQVVIIGDFFPEALLELDNTIFVQCIPGAAWTFPFEKFAHQNVTLIHAFDLAAGVFAGVLSIKMKVPLVVTKCGGSPLSKYHFTFSNMIVFHEADLVNLQTHVFRPVRLKLIPHRVNPPHLQDKPELNPFDNFGPTSMKIMAISRICKGYERKLQQAITLREKISRRLGPASLCIIGSVEDIEVLQRLKNLCAGCEYINLLTDDNFTYKAARYLVYSDAAVATGRGAMEALSYGNYVFVPVANSKIPCLLLPGNYQEAFRENFSQRVRLSVSVNPDEALETLLSKYTKEMKAWYNHWAQVTFEINHSSVTGAQETLKFYSLISGHEGAARVMFSAFMYWLRFRVVRRLKARLK